eukprot:m.513216 g.513216  ORF g.513216 m.513216 type:complete len:117 (-) comp57438_c0_seq73:289-639(-)
MRRTATESRRSCALRRKSALTSKIRATFIELLLHHGASPSIRTLNGRTARDLAESNEIPDLVRLFDAHEAYLANLGAHTKPALRYPASDMAVPALAAIENSVNLLHWSQLIQFNLV